MTDESKLDDNRLFDRLTFRFDTSKVSLAPIPWPAGLEPTPVETVTPLKSGKLPKADVLVVTWTVAEAQALADVLTPGHSTDTWVKYTKGFKSYLPHLTWKSPAKETQALGSYWLGTIGHIKVVYFHCGLHLATDDDTLPLRSLWKQVIEDTNPNLVITTGTAGGVGAETVEGDVLVTNTARFDCQRMFKDQSFGQQTFSSAPFGIFWDDTTALLAANAGQLSAIASRPPQVIGGQVLTTDFFAYDNDTDHYGLRAYDSTARMVEMDDASLGLACSEDIQNPPEWVSIRNASDPQVSSSVGDLDAQSTWAANIYKKYGYWTTVGSAIVTWAAITGYERSRGNLSEP